MTEHDFERERGRLWHNVLKNGLLLGLTPADRDWRGFSGKALAALQNRQPFDWPAIDPNSKTVRFAADAWLDGANGAPSGQSEFTQFLSSFDQIRYLRPAKERTSTPEMAKSWVSACSDVLRQARQTGTPVAGDVFWPAAVQLERLMRELEYGTDTFWQHFEQEF